MLLLQIGCPRNKQTKSFGSNRNKPKLNLFRFIFGLFRETNKFFFRFVSVRFGISDQYRNNRNKQICFETNRKNGGENAKINFLNTFFSFGFLSHFSEIKSPRVLAPFTNLKIVFFYMTF
jgi:hypothetical protein